MINNITKPFMSGRSQAVRIPKEFRFDDEDLFINKIGSSLVLTPVSSLEAAYREGIALFTEDFLADGRPEELANERVSFD